MRLTVVGSGDAFGTGGRNQACYLVEAAGETLMLDCGATTTVALERMGRDPNTIPALLISHLHGDHFGGVVFFVVQALFGTARKGPLTVYGPPGIETRFRAAMEVFYPGFLSQPLPFSLAFVEIAAEAVCRIGPLDVTAYVVDHPSGAPSYGYRLTDGRSTLAFTGDSRWTETLLPLGRDADLYIMECYAPETTAAAHLTWSTIAANLDRIGAKRVILTHMNREMLARRHEVRHASVFCAEDGQVIDL